MNREEWNSFYYFLSRQDRDETKLVIWSRNLQKASPPSRLRRFFVYTEEKLPPSITMGCRRVVRLLPHPTRRMEDVLRLAQPTIIFEIADLKKQWFGMVSGCTLWTGASVMTFLGWRELATGVSFVILYTLPLVALGNLAYQWRRAGYKKVERKQWARFVGDVVISSLTYALAMGFSQLAGLALQQGQMETLVAFLGGLLFISYIFSSLITRALANFARGFETA